MVKPRTAVLLFPASSTMIVNGKPVALVGDKVSCPIP
ncbi:hypothetical protein C5706_32560, partial [Klebsiella pneumoniae]